MFDRLHPFSDGSDSVTPRWAKMNVEGVREVKSVSWSTSNFRQREQILPVRGRGGKLLTGKFRCHSVIQRPVCLFRRNTSHTMAPISNRITLLRTPPTITAIFGGRCVILDFGGSLSAAAVDSGLYGGRAITWDNTNSLGIAWFDTFPTFTISS